MKGVPPDDLFDSVFDELLDVHAVKQLVVCAPALRELFNASKDKKRTQRAILACVTGMVTAPKHGDGLLKQTSAILTTLCAWTQPTPTGYTHARPNRPRAAHTCGSHVDALHTTRAPSPPRPPAAC